MFRLEAFYVSLVFIRNASNIEKMRLNTNYSRQRKRFPFFLSIYSYRNKVFGQSDPHSLWAIF